MERNELCWCGSGKKYKRCHMAMEEKMEQLREAGHIVPERELLKTPAQIEAIKKSAELNTAVLDHVAKHIHAGMSTEDIDVLVHDFTVSHGGIPAPLGYEGFPKRLGRCHDTERRHHRVLPDRRIDSDGVFVPVHVPGDDADIRCGHSRAVCTRRVAVQIAV